MADEPNALHCRLRDPAFRERAAPAVDRAADAAFDEGKLSEEDEEALDAVVSLLTGGKRGLFIARRARPERDDGGGGSPARAFPGRGWGPRWGRSPDAPWNGLTWRFTGNGETTGTQ